MSDALPHCLHRGQEVTEGNFRCRSDRILHTGTVSADTCRRCPYPNKPRDRSEGLGDTAHKVAHFLKVDTLVQAVVGDCGCKERRDWLNQKVSYITPVDDPNEPLPERCASSLPARAPLEAPVRNLMMYIYPVHEFEVWRWNIEQIRKRMHLFNGKRIVTVMTDSGTDTLEDVQEAFGDERVDFWVTGFNDGWRWEMQGLPRMMRYVHSCDPDEITFYCHAKGVQGPEHIDGPTFHQQPRVKWATAMYGSCLDDMPFVEKQLETHTFAGPFKRRMVHGAPPFRSSWHFSGTFYWFRNARLFALDNWHHFEHQLFGAETYPGQLVGWGQSANLFGEHPPILYLQDAWTGQMDALWEQWKQEHGLCTPA